MRPDHGEDGAALRLLLRAVRQDDAADRGLLLLEGLHDQTIAKRLSDSFLDLHFVTVLVTLFGTLADESASAASIAQASPPTATVFERAAGVLGRRRARPAARPERWVRRGDPAGRQARRGLGAAEGPDRRGREPARRRRCARSPRRRASRGRSPASSARSRYWFNWDGERVFKIVAFFLVRYESGRLGDIPAEFRHEVAEVRWLPLDEAPALLAYARRAGDGRARRFAALAERAYDRGRTCLRSPSTSTRRSSRRSSARTGRPRRSGSATSRTSTRRG